MCFACLGAQMPTCPGCLRAHVPLCLVCLGAHMPTYLGAHMLTSLTYPVCLHAHVPTCLVCSGAHIPMCLACSHVLTCQCDLNASFDATIFNFAAIAAEVVHTAGKV